MQSIAQANERQQWKTILWLGDNAQEEIVFTGPSLVSLKDQVTQWLESNQPTHISNYPIKGVFPSRRREYVFCSHPQRADEVFPHLKLTRNGLYISGAKELPEGWHCAYFKRERPAQREYYPDITTLGSKEALAVHLRSTLVCWCGPDYIDPLLENGRIVSERVMTIARVDEIVQVNDMLRRGWRLITLEMKGSEDEMGRLVSQSAAFVLGHPETDAT